MNILIDYIHVIYAVFVWGFALVFIKPKRIKELLPIAVLSFVMLFLAEEYLISLGLYKFNNPSLSVYGIPFLHLIWGSGSGLVFMNYMKKDFSNQILLVTFFTILTLAFEYLAESLGVASHLGNFTEIHDTFQDFITLALILWISEGLWANRIYSNLLKLEDEKAGSSPNFKSVA